MRSAGEGDDQLQLIRNFMGDPTQDASHPARHATVFAAIARDDDLGAVVRSAAYTEQYLRELISRNFEDPDEIKWSSISMETRIQMAVAGKWLPHSFKKTLKQFAELRNKYAHDLDHVAQANELDKIMNGMDARVRSVYDGDSTRIARARGISDTQYQLRRLCVTVVSMVLMCLVAANLRRAFVQTLRANREPTYAETVISNLDSWLPWT